MWQKFVCFHPFSLPFSLFVHSSIFPFLSQPYTSQIGITSEEWTPKNSPTNGEEKTGKWSTGSCPAESRSTNKEFQDFIISITTKEECGTTKVLYWTRRHVTGSKILLSLNRRKCTWLPRVQVWRECYSWLFIGFTPYFYHNFTLGNVNRLLP